MAPGAAPVGRRRRWRHRVMRERSRPERPSRSQTSPRNSSWLAPRPRAQAWSASCSAMGEALRAGPPACAAALTDSLPSTQLTEADDRIAEERKASHPAMVLDESYWRPALIISPSSPRYAPCHARQASSGSLPRSEAKGSCAIRSSPHSLILQYDQSVENGLKPVGLESCP